MGSARLAALFIRYAELQRPLFSHIRKRRRELTLCRPSRQRRFGGGFLRDPLVKRRPSEAGRGFWCRPPPDGSRLMSRGFDDACSIRIASADEGKPESEGDTGLKGEERAYLQAFLALPGEEIVQASRLLAGAVRAYSGRL